MIEKDHSNANEIAIFAKDEHYFDTSNPIDVDKPLSNLAPAKSMTPSQFACAIVGLSAACALPLLEASGSTALAGPGLLALWLSGYPFAVHARGRRFGFALLASFVFFVAACAFGIWIANKGLTTWRHQPSAIQYAALFESGRRAAWAAACAASLLLAFSTKTWLVKTGAALALFFLIGIIL